jgi:hypothetical protein
MQSVSSNAVAQALKDIKSIITSTYTSFANLQTSVLGFNGLRVDCVSLTPSATDSNSPIATANYYWWNVITFGYNSRQTQIAIQAYIGFTYTNALYVRSYHDNRWSSWVQK